VKKKRPFGLIAIVLYKTFVSALLLMTAIALLLTLDNYEALADFSDSYTLEGKSGIIDWGLEKLLNLSPRTLQFSGLGALGYAIVTEIEAIGLWYEKRWAHILVLFLVGISIPPEIYELSRGISIVKAIVFLINVAVFVYLLKSFPEHSSSKDS
jgi:uncharacterized membrane protein (DUF2068 family)